MPKSNRNTARAIRRMRSATASCLEFMTASLKKSVLLSGGEDEDVSPMIDIYLQVAAVALGVGEPAGLVLAFGDFRRFLAALTIEPGQQHGVFRVLLRRRFRQRLRRPEIKLHPAHLQTHLPPPPHPPPPPPPPNKPPPPRRRPRPPPGGPPRRFFSWRGRGRGASGGRS